MELEKLLNKQPILLYDGDCGFCNKSIQFFLSREKNNQMHFASLQSETGKQLKHYFEINDKVDSMILIKDYSAFIKSCAALRLTLFMRGLWPVVIIFVIIPPFIRNIVYDFIARRRKRLLKSNEICLIPTSENRQRFLDTIL